MICLASTGDASDGLIREVEARLLLLHEAGVEAALALCDRCRSRPRQSRGASAGVVPAATAPSGNCTLPFKPPPP